jgi:hypothetical protein
MHIQVAYAWRSGSQPQGNPSLSLPFSFQSQVDPTICICHDHASYLPNSIEFLYAFMWRSTTCGALHLADLGVTWYKLFKRQPQSTNFYSALPTPLTPEFSLILQSFGTTVTSRLCQLQTAPARWPRRRKPCRAPIISPTNTTSKS